MLIALDYDKTYTRDPILWTDFILLAKVAGHVVICLTMRRYPEEKIPKEHMETIDIIYTDRKAKKKYAEEHNLFVDIWIDDNPAWLFEDAL